MKEHKMGRACGADAAELNVGRPYRKDGFYDLYVGAEGDR
jgi:hypothetical protein